MGNAEIFLGGIMTALLTVLILLVFYRYHQKRKQRAERELPQATYRDKTPRDYDNRNHIP